MKKIPAIEVIGILVIVIIEPIVDAVDPTKITRTKSKEQCPSHRYMQKTINTNFTCKTKSNIISEIEKTKNKTLVVNKTFGKRNVRYYEHKMYNFTVKNDSIMLHLEKGTGKLIDYHKTWTEIKINTIEFEKSNFTTYTYYWKEKVIFPDKDDCKHFYSFKENLDYPIACWEVRYIDGQTIMYNAKGEEIGRGVPAPSDSFALSGYDKNKPHDPWREWRNNAVSWFMKWSNRTISLFHPSNKEISNYISDPRVNLFYEIGHSGGLPTRFQSQGDQIYYTSDMIRDNISHRSPIKFAMLCSCEAMNDTGPGTLSYEFRKGQTDQTVTVGYVGMGSCPGWYDSLDWQDSMFSKIDRGFTVENAFILACAQFPKIADCVKIVGDSEIKIVENKAEETKNEVDDKPRNNNINILELIGQLIIRILFLDKQIQNLKIKKIPLN